MAAGKWEDATAATTTLQGTCTPCHGANAIGRNIASEFSKTYRHPTYDVTPSVHDGKVFTTSYGGGSWLFAVDPGQTEKPVAEVWRNKIQGYMSTPVVRDGHAYVHLRNQRFAAIDLATGKEAWRTVKGDYKKGFTHSSGPVIANGVVVSGISGCEMFKVEGCFITGHDPETGKELWRAGYEAPYKMHSAAVPHGQGPKSTPVFSNGKLFSIGMTGVVTAWDGGSAKAGGRIIAAGDARVHGAAMKLLNG